MAFNTFEREVLLIGYGNDGGLRLNPKDREYIFKPGDRVWFIGNDREAVGRALSGSKR